MGIYPCKECGALFISVNMTQEPHAATCSYGKRCARYLRQGRSSAAEVLNEHWQALHQFVTTNDQEV